MQRHRLALVAVLSVAPGHQVSRDRAVALLWPESDDQQGRTLLNTTVHALRRALGADAIQSVGDALYLNADRVDCDAIRIEQHRVAGRLDEAVAEYTGPFLDGFHLPDSPPFEEWLGQTREQLSSVHAKSLERLAMAAAGKGDTLGAVRWWTAFTRHLPFSQLGATNLVTALAAAGERAEAIAAGEQFATRLRAELEVEPDEELLRLLARLRADWVAAPVEPDTRPAAAAALPPESTDSAPSLGQHALTSIAPALDVEATSEVAATHRQPARGTRGRVRALTLAAAALVVFALAATMWPTRSGDGVVSDDVVLLAPFEYEGPPALSYLGEGIIDLIAAQLSSQTQFRTVLSRPFIAGISAGAFPNSAARLDEVRHAAREVGARRMIVGTIKLAGNVLALSASIVRTNTPLPEQPDAEISGSQDSLLVLTDRLAAQLLVGQVANLADATPGMLSARSLVAIEPYLRGRAAYRRGEWAGAAAHFQHALETDSTFAQAALGLALAENFGGNTARWNWAMNTLQAQQGQLNRVEFLMWDALIGRALPRRKAGWTEVTVLSPDQPEGWYELGDVEYHWGSLLGDADPLRSAFDHFSRALRTDPGFAPALSHIVELLAGNRET
ncbi:MAG: BTAD domain-containing putative transcriptional regulator, partial [Gemmatimonadota bacterium]|nr:BTAD domain-containing putative transcriptional regulator [Gemmatimonadota bacterium]